MLENKNWQDASIELSDKGFFTLKSIILPSQYNELIALYNKPIYRSAISIARYQFGFGEYKYFNYPLPQFVQSLCALHQDLYGDVWFPFQMIIFLNER